MSDKSTLKKQKKERIWELDTLRGIAIIGVVIVHLVFDLGYFLGKDLNLPPLFNFIQEYGSILFIVLSGICVTLGHRFVKRGLIVLGAGMLITVVTYFMYKLGISGKDIIVYWGILHLLGACMLLYGLLRKLPTAVLPVLAAVLCTAGYILGSKYFDISGPGLILVIFGFIPRTFETGDYFPLLPHLGWFTLGIFMGRTLYKKQKSLIPAPVSRFKLMPLGENSTAASTSAGTAATDAPTSTALGTSPETASLAVSLSYPRYPRLNDVIGFFSFLGRHSLWIYLLHQPLISCIIALIEAAGK